MVLDVVALTYIIHIISLPMSFICCSVGWLVVSLTVSSVLSVCCSVGWLVVSLNGRFYLFAVVLVGLLYH